MQTFLDLVTAAARVDDRRPGTDIALAAILLDRTTMTPDHLLSGVHMIRTGDTGMIGWMVDSLRIVLDGKRSVKTPREAEQIGLLSCDVVVVTDADPAKTQAMALVQARLHGASLVAIGPNLDGIHADIRAVADDTWRLPPIDGDMFADVVQAVTGDDVECDYAGPISPTDVIIAVLSEATGQTCIDNLKKLRKSRDAKARAGDIHDFIAGLDAQPLGAVAQRVVTRLRDLHGYGEAKEWGLRLADDLRAYQAGEIAWDDVDRGVLLSGPPGCGKTYFARALAAECGVTLIVTGYSDWMAQKGAGDSASKAIKRLFDDARAKAPCIVFIDEIDAMGVRGQNDHNESYWTAVIDSLLAELDGAVPRPGVIVCAATNHPEKVDPALKRAGRLDRHIEISRPTIDDLRGVIMHQLGAGASDDGLEDAARACRGRSPADIAQLAREARRTSRKARREATASDVAAEAIRTRPARSKSDDWQIALHEGAHALAAVVLGQHLQHVDIDTCEATMRAPAMLATREMIEQHIACALAGRIANTLHGAGPTAGASEDLAMATKMALDAVARYGMGGRLSALPDGAAWLDPAVRREVEGMLSRADAVARELLGEHERELLRLAEALVERRYLDGDEVRAIVHGKSQQQSA